MPSNTVYDVYQDDNGFIWIGTDKGVARYNGRNFEIFTTANGLSDNECFFFRKDYEGRLWLITFNGELCYYKDGIFHNAANTPFLKLNSKASLFTAFSVYKDSSITFALHDDPGFFEIKGEKITHYTHPLLAKEKFDSHFRAVDKTPDGFEIYFSNNKVIYDRITKNYKLDSYGKLHFKSGFMYNDTEMCFRDDISIYNSKLQRISFIDPSSLREKHIYKMYEYNGTKISITNKGIIFDGKCSFLEDNDIYSLTKDHNDNYWISTAKNGIYKISSGFLKQKQYKLDAKQPVIHAYNAGQNILYTTNDRNVYFLDIKTNKTKQIFDFTRTTNRIRWAKSVSWVWKDNYYNFSMDQNFKITRTSPAGDFKISKIRVKNIDGAYKKFDVGNYIFLKSSHNFGFFHKRDFEANKHTITPHFLIKKVTSKIYGAALDENQQLWFSLNNKVYKVEDTVAVVQSQFNNAGFRELIFFNHCFVGITPHNELIVYNNYNGSRIYSKVIKSNNCIWDKFYIINDTVLLISTSDYFRILKIERTAGKINYALSAIENPLIPYQPDYLLTDSTSCYFFRQNTLNVFPISYLLEQAPLPEMRFRLLKTKINSFSIKDTMRLDYATAQNIRILYTAVSYNNSTLTYEYSITSDKSGETWYPVEGEELNLVKLNHGGFNISIRTKTITGAYSKPVSFYLVIDKPYWATWWFIASCSVIFACLLFYFINLRVKSKLKRKESEIKFLKSEYKALNAMMNPHFIFNSLNSVQGLVNSNDPGAASKYIRIFSDLIRQNMHNVTNELIPLEKEMELVENYIKIEQLRLNNTLQYHILIQPDLETDLIMVPPLLIQPLVENAIKHGIWPNESENGRIEIGISEKDNFVLIDIRDNGKGLVHKSSSDTNHQSYAITNLQKRFDQLSKIHNTKMTIEIKDITDSQGNILGVQSLVSVAQNR